MKYGITLSPELLQEALVHRSFSFEIGVHQNNERLEFLGDSVLGLAVSHHLFEVYPDCTEGQLSAMRSHIVSGESIAEVARSLGLGEFMLLGKGERLSGGMNKTSLLANLLESIIGAVMIDHGFDRSKDFVLAIFADKIYAMRRLSVHDPKGRLQKLVSSKLSYAITEEGPPHNRVFYASVVVNGKIFSGQGSTKKQAQLSAAQDALQSLKDTIL